MSAMTLPSVYETWTDIYLPAAMEPPSPPPSPGTLSQGRAGRAPGGQAAPPADEAAVLFDEPSIRYAMGERWGTDRSMSATVDLARLVRRVESAGPVVRWRHYLTRATSSGGRDPAATDARRQGWQVTLTPAEGARHADRHWHHVAKRILTAKSMLGTHAPNTLALVSHDDRLAGPLRAYLDAGGHALLIGFENQWGPELADCAWHIRSRRLPLEPTLVPATARRRCA